MRRSRTVPGHKHCPVFETFFLTILFALFFAAGAGAATGTVNEDGTLCTLPDFSFEWLGNSELNLVARTDSFQEMKVRLRPHRSAGKDSASTRCCDEASEGCEVSLEECRESACHRPTTQMWVPASSGDQAFLPLGTPSKVGGKYESRVDLNPDELCLQESDGLVVVAWETGAQLSERCKSFARGTTGPILALRRHTLSLDAGPVFSLENDGSFENGLELAITSTSRWTKRWTGYSDLRFSRIGAIDDSETTDPTPPGNDDGMPTGADDTPTTPAAEDEDVFNPFAEGGNVVSFNAWMGLNLVGGPKTRLTSPISLIFGGGFTTRPGEAADLEARTRLFAGLRFQIARYGTEASQDLAGSSGYLQFGIAQDELWKFTELRDLDGDPLTDAVPVSFDEKDRWFIETQVTIPNISLGSDESGRLKVRLYADLPQSGDGPSDVRISALFQYDITRLIRMIRPSS